MQGIHENLERERLDAIYAAKDLKYQTSVIDRLKNADSIAEIDRTMIQARHDWSLEME